MINLIHHIKEAFINLQAAKLRSFLAILGVLVGTASVVAMVSSGQLATAKALEQFKSLGTDLLAVSLAFEDPATSSASANKNLDEKTIGKLTQTVPEVLSVAPYTTLFVPIYVEGHEIEGSVIGATSSLQTLIKIQLSEGRFISFLDGNNYEQFCVIGSKIYQSMKASGVINPLGKQIQLGKAMFTVIGIAAPWSENSFFNEDINNSILIPIQQSFVINRHARLSHVLVRLQQTANINEVETKIKHHFNIIAPQTRLFFRSAKELIKSMKVQQDTLTLLLGLIGSISLIVGGIGVMNIMLVSVMERHREIGLRLALGARRKEIQLLFLVEGVVLSLLGGTLGVILGLMASFIVATAAHWHFKIYWLPPLVGFMVSVAVGVFFGFYPAYKASNLDPIHALRSEV